MNYKVGNTIHVEGILTKFVLSESKVTIAYPGKMDAEYGFTYYPLGIGPLGDRGFVPADKLKFGNPYLVTSILSDNTCTHVRTSTRCRIRYDSLFAVNGEFTLFPLEGGDPMHCKSEHWRGSVLRDHLEYLKGKNIEARGVLSYIYDDYRCVFHTQIEANFTARHRASNIYFFLTFPDGSLKEYPASLWLDKITEDEKEAKKNKYSIKND